jgi:hypothetical protein
MASIVHFSTPVHAGCTVQQHALHGCSSVHTPRHVMFAGQLLSYKRNLTALHLKISNSFNTLQQQHHTMMCSTKNPNHSAPDRKLYGWCTSLFMTHQTTVETNTPYRPANLHNTDIYSIRVENAQPQEHPQPTQLQQHPAAEYVAEGPSKHWLRIQYTCVTYKPPKLKHCWHQHRPQQQSSPHSTAIIPHTKRASKSLRQLRSNT